MKHKSKFRANTEGEDFLVDEEGFEFNRVDGLVGEICEVIHKHIDGKLGVPEYLGLDIPGEYRIGNFHPDVIAFREALWIKLLEEVNRG